MKRALLTFLFPVALYAGSLANGFVWDDHALIVKNPRIDRLDTRALADIFTTNYWQRYERAGGLYRPAVTLSFHLDHRLYGLEPWGYHLTNMLLHGAVCVLVYLLGLALFGNATLALASALLFAAHPMHTENVAWIAGRTDVVAAFWTLVSLVLYVRARTGGRHWLIAPALACYVAALAAKEVTVVVPFVVAAIEWAGVAPGRREASRARRVIGPVLYAVVVWIFVSVRIGVLGIPLGSYERLAAGAGGTAALALAVFAGYVGKLVWPFTPNAEYEVAVPPGFSDPRVVAGAVLVAAILFLAVRYRRHRELVVGFAFLIIFLVPVSNLVPLTEVSAERFLYLPSVGFALVLAWVVERLSAGVGRVPATGALVAVLALYGTRTVARTLDWHDDMRLFTKTVVTAPDNPRAHVNLAGAYVDAGNPQQAVTEYRRAVTLLPDYAEAWAGLAKALRATGAMDEALTAIGRALDIDPENPGYYNILGKTHAQRNEHAAAAEDFRAALRIDPDDTDARFNLALATLALGDENGARDLFTSLTAIDPGYALAYYFLAVIADHAGDATARRTNAQQFLALYGKDDRYAAHARALAQTP